MIPPIKNNKGLKPNITKVSFQPRVKEKTKQEMDWEVCWMIVANLSPIAAWITETSLKLRISKVYPVILGAKEPTLFCSNQANSCVLNIKWKNTCLRRAFKYAERALDAWRDALTEKQTSFTSR
jgi:hypothetical protein